MHARLDEEGGKKDRIMLALEICPWRASHAGIRGYGPRRPLSMAKRGASRRDLDLGHGLTPITVLWYDTTLV